MLKITVLMENQAADPIFKSQWGLSLLLQYEAAAILFDTGEDACFLDNLTHLKINADNLTHIVLSHGHYDHTGGLAALLSSFGSSPSNTLPLLITHPGALTKRYRIKNGKTADLSMPPGSRKALAAYPKVTFSAKPLWLNNQIVFLGEIPRKYPHLTCLAGMLYESDQPDPILDDSGLAIITPGGLVVITGCAHAGVVNIIEHAQAVTGINKVYALIGGLHLHDAPQPVIDGTMTCLNKLGIEKILHGHCTGEVCFGARGQKICAGKTFLL